MMIHFLRPVIQRRLHQDTYIWHKFVTLRKWPLPAKDLEYLSIECHILNLRHDMHNKQKYLYITFDEARFCTNLKYHLICYTRTDMVIIFIT